MLTLRGPQPTLQNGEKDLVLTGHPDVSRNLANERKKVFPPRAKRRET